MSTTPDFSAGRWPIDEAEQTLRAIREGAVDAFVVEEPEGHRVYTLEGADLPYSTLVEQMRQGAAMLSANGNIVYCNPSLATLLGVPQATVTNSPLQDFLDAADQPACQKLLGKAQDGSCQAEMRVRRADGTLISAEFSFRLLSRDKSTIGLLVTDLTVQKYHAELTTRLQRLQDEERRRIARELHDSVGQLLAGISMNITRVQREAHKLTPAVGALVHENAAMVNEVSKEIRTISYLLHPPLLDVAGLASALRWYIDGFSERSKIKVDVEIPADFRRLSGDTEIAIFRMVQECLTNVHRHSGSAWCTVKMIEDKEQLRIEIRDGGRGIPESKRSILSSAAGVGLRGMQERLQHLGGTLTVDSNESGTTVTAVLPVPHTAQIEQAQT